MKLIVAWLIAVSTPNIPNAGYLSILFNTAAECKVALEQADVEDGVAAECIQVGIWIPVQTKI